MSADRPFVRYKNETDEERNERFVKYTVKMLEEQKTSTDLILAIVVNDLKEKQVDKAVAEIVTEYFIIEKAEREAEQESIRSQHDWSKEQDRIMEEIRKLPESEKIENARKNLQIAEEYRKKYIESGSFIHKDGLKFYQNHARRYVNSSTFERLQSELRVDYDEGRNVFGTAELSFSEKVSYIFNHGFKEYEKMIRSKRT